MGFDRHLGRGGVDAPGVRPCPVDRCTGHTRTARRTGALVALTFLAVPALAQAQASGPLALAIGDRNGRGGAATPDAFDEALKKELERLDRVRVVDPPRARYVVRGSVTQLKRVRRDERLHIRCRVSLLLADRRTGSIRLMLSGGVAVPAGTPEAKQRALAAAIRGALRPLPRTMHLAGPFAQR